MSISEQPVALVTGGGTGVGRACVLQFAKRGYNVAVNYSKSSDDAELTVRDAKALGVDAIAIQCDVADDAAVRLMLQTVEQRFGRLDALVNNAAMTRFIDSDDMEGLTEPIWDRIMDVNLKGAFFVTRAAAPMLKAGDGGSIVNISSVAAVSGRGSSIAYCASKAGLNTMTKSLAIALSPEVRVNSVCPGPINSRWIREGKPELNVDEMVANFPLPRPSEPDDIADAVLFFSVGTRMATGQILMVDGGQLL